MWLYAPLLILLGLGFTGTYYKGHTDGAESRNKEIVQLRTAVSVHERISVEAANKAAKAAAEVRVEYRERLVKIREAAPPPKVIERIVYEAAQNPDCSTVPPTLVSLWNTGPDGDKPDPPGGATVSVAQLAEAVSEARQRFEFNKAQLDAIQNYMRKTAP